MWGIYTSDSNRNLRAVQDMKTVAIIGGGLTGLLSLRHILNYHSLQPTLFEASSFVGGIWAYDGKANVYGHQHDHHTTHPSVYKNLVTNQSKQIMEFPDFKHENETLPSFFHHSYVLHYLQQFAAKFSLLRFIQFNRRVVKVFPISSNETTTPCRWNIVVSDGTKKDSFLNLIFDAVVVCNGHFTKPYIPKIRGFASFRGSSLHSRYYRQPDDFAQKTVLVIGASPSGVDISMDLTPIAKKVYLCNRLNQGKPLLNGLPNNVTEVGNNTRRWSYLRSFFLLSFYTTSNSTWAFIRQNKLLFTVWILISRKGFWDNIRLTLMNEIRNWIYLWRFYLYL